MLNGALKSRMGRLGIRIYPRITRIYANKENIIIRISYLFLYDLFAIIGVIRGQKINIFFSVLHLLRKQCCAKSHHHLRIFRTFYFLSDLLLEQRMKTAVLRPSAHE